MRSFFAVIFRKSFDLSQAQGRAVSANDRAEGLVIVSLRHLSLFALCSEKSLGVAAVCILSEDSYGWLSNNAYRPFAFSHMILIT